LNDIGRNSLLGKRKKIAKFFNEDFYLPLYLPLWPWPCVAVFVSCGGLFVGSD
jgi:hypothetical protein